MDLPYLTDARQDLKDAQEKIRSINLEFDEYVTDLKAYGSSPDKSTQAYLRGVLKALGDTAVELRSQKSKETDARDELVALYFQGPSLCTCSRHH